MKCSHTAQYVDVVNINVQLSGVCVCGELGEDLNQNILRGVNLSMCCTNLSSLNCFS